MSTVIGVVAEGSHDFFALEEIIRRELPQDYQRPISFVYLQPELDATSNQKNDGGWSKVLGWCLAHKGDLVETHFVPLEDGDRVCDILIVQLDGDAMAPCSAHSANAAPSEPCAVANRVQAVEHMITEWLEPEPHRSTSIKFAVPVMQTEAWVMSALDPNAHVWETFPDCKTELRKKRKSGESTKNLYLRLSKEAGNNLGAIPAQSFSYRRFVAGL